MGEGGAASRKGPPAWGRVRDNKVGILRLFPRMDAALENEARSVAVADGLEDAPHLSLLPFE